MKVALYYCNEDNFGDQLNIPILKHYGFDSHLARPIDSDISGIGSILGCLGPKFRGLVYGSGLISADQCFDARNAKVLALRGRLTQDRVTNAGCSVLGDPGLLVSRVYSQYKGREPIYELGIVPHYTEIEDYQYIIKNMKDSLSRVSLIDVRDHCKNVIASITLCKAIATSSLHGMIVADAFAIPVCWLTPSSKIEGGEFKFHDYLSSMELKRSPRSLSKRHFFELACNNLTVAPQDKVLCIQQELETVLKSLSNHIVMSRIKRYPINNLHKVYRMVMRSKESFKF